MFIDVRPRLANLRAGMEVNAGGISRLLKTVSPLMFRVTVVFEPSRSMSAGLLFNALVRVLPRLSWKMVPGGKGLGISGRRKGQGVGAGLKEHGGKGKNEGGGELGHDGIRVLVRFVMSLRELSGLCGLVCFL